MELLASEKSSFSIFPVMKGLKCSYTLQVKIHVNSSFSINSSFFKTVSHIQKTFYHIILSKFNISSEYVCHRKLKAIVQYNRSKRLNKYFYSYKTVVSKLPGTRNYIPIVDFKIFGAFLKTIMMKSYRIFCFNRLWFTMNPLGFPLQERPQISSSKIN